MRSPVRRILDAVEFLRVVSEERCGVQPEQAIGSSVRTKYELRNGMPAIVRRVRDQHPGRPEGRPPAAAAVIRPGC